LFVPERVLSPEHALLNSASNLLVLQAPFCIQPVMIMARFNLLFVMTGLIVAFSSNVAFSQQGFNPNEAESMMSSNVVELKDQLYFGLRTFRPDQQAFLDQVVAKVDNGEISRAMVNVIYVWARKRNPKVPFPYFEIAMRLLAEKRGVTFP
jgi:hypothetical protein